MSDTSTMLSATTGGPAPTSTATCYPYSAPNLRNVTGLEGQICQVNWSPSIINITSCCGNNTVPRVQDNCTQYCVYNGRSLDFGDCVTGLLSDGAEQEETHTYCFILGSDGSQTNTTNNGSASTSASASATETTNAATNIVSVSFPTWYVMSITCGGLLLGTAFML